MPVLRSHPHPHATCHTHTQRPHPHHTTYTKTSLKASAGATETEGHALSNEQPPPNRITGRAKHRRACATVRTRHTHTHTHTYTHTHLSPDGGTLIRQSDVDVLKVWQRIIGPIHHRSFGLRSTPSPRTHACTNARSKDARTRQDDRRTRRVMRDVLHLAPSLSLARIGIPMISSSGSSKAAATA